MINKKETKEIIIKVMKKAGRSLEKNFQTLKQSDIKLKAKKDIVTKADLESEKIIIKELKKHFPEHTILSEEAGLNDIKSDYIWIIDPLDGTTNFSFHNPIWSIAIALAYKGEIIIGAVYIPILKELFFAEKGKGAYLNGKRIKVVNNALKKINTFCHGNNSQALKKALKYYHYQKIHSFDCRQLGSAEIELSYVAAGRTESIFIPEAKVWDMAAGYLIVTEAGGKVTDFKNKKWTLKSNDILAAHPKIHKKIMEIIKKLKLDK